MITQVTQPSLPARGRVGGMALVGYAWRQVKLGAQAPGKRVLSSTTEAAAAAAVYMITVPNAHQYLWVRGIMGDMQEWGGFVNLVGVSLRKSRRAWAL